MRNRAVLLAALFLPLAAAAEAPPRTVERVELDRYLGTWHEIAAIPMFFQRQCVGDTRAEYARAKDGRIAVRNSCATREGSDSAEGRARVVDAASNAKLEVTFLRLFGDWRFWAGGDYWVIELDPDYRWAVVGHPTRKYGWVLARAPQPDTGMLRDIAARIGAQGYDTCAFRMTRQGAAPPPAETLCQIE